MLIYFNFEIQILRAFGIVYLAKYQNRNVAVKEINSEVIDSKEVDAFVKEAEVMRKLSPHPNVLGFVGICSSPFCIVTEYMARGDLWHYLKANQNIEMKQKLMWINEICYGVSQVGRQKKKFADDLLDDSFSCIWNYSPRFGCPKLFIK